MELEGSLPCSQDSANGPYSEPDQSDNYYSIESLQKPSYYYPSTYVSFLSGLFSSGVPTENLHVFLFSLVSAIIFPI
jgi:hypothetical protein